MITMKEDKKGHYYPHDPPTCYIYIYMIYDTLVIIQLNFYLHILGLTNNDGKLYVNIHSGAELYEEKGEKIR